MKDHICQRLAERLATDKITMEPQVGYHNSAVLVPLVWQKDEWNILFEVRSTHLKWQPGEICFPGGHMEKDDETPDITAVRETCEELGLQKDAIKLLGSLKYIVSQIGVIVQPYVGVFSSYETLHPNTAEVGEIFMAPLSFFLTAKPLKAQMEVATRPLPGFPFELVPQYDENWLRRGTYPVYFYQYHQYTIWGITARILHDFLKIYRNL